MEQISTWRTSKTGLSASSMGDVRTRRRSISIVSVINGRCTKKNAETFCCWCHEQKINEQDKSSKNNLFPFARVWSWKIRILIKHEKWPGANVHGWVRKNYRNIQIENNNNDKGYNKNNIVYRENQERLHRLTHQVVILKLKSQAWG